MRCSSASAAAASGETVGVEFFSQHDIRSYGSSKCVFEQQFGKRQFGHSIHFLIKHLFRDCLIFCSCFEHFGIL